MKTRFSRRRNILPAGTHVAFLVAGACVVVLLILRFFFPGVLTTLATPFWQVGSAISSSLLVFENTQTLAREHRELTAQFEALQNENLSLKTSLKDIGLLEREDGDIVAGVLARPPLSPYDVLVVNRGTRDGVVVGALTYAKGGVPVGVVADASAMSSRIALFSSAGYVTEGWVGEAQLPVTFVGEGAGTFSSHVPRESEILAGDLVYVAGGGARPIGVVSEVKSEASSPEAELRIRPFVSPFSIPWVVIGKPFL